MLKKILIMMTLISILILSGCQLYVEHTDKECEIAARIDWDMENPYCEYDDFIDRCECWEKEEGKYSFDYEYYSIKTFKLKDACEKISSCN